MYLFSYLSLLVYNFSPSRWDMYMRLIFRPGGSNPRNGVLSCGGSQLKREEGRESWMWRRRKEGRRRVGVWMRERLVVAREKGGEWKSDALYSQSFIHKSVCRHCLSSNVTVLGLLGATRLYTLTGNHRAAGVSGRRAEIRAYGRRMEYLLLPPAGDVQTSSLFVLQSLLLNADLGSLDQPHCLAIYPRSWLWLAGACL